MNYNHGTPIQDALKECTKEEREAIASRTPPYDGVRTWGDLLAVREQMLAKPEEEDAIYPARSVRSQ